METLWDLLKDEYKEKLIKEQDKYPNVVKTIKKDFTNNIMWCDLTIFTVSTLVTFVNLELNKQDAFFFKYGEGVLNPRKDG